MIFPEILLVKQRKCQNYFKSLAALDSHPSVCTVQQDAHHLHLCKQGWGHFWGRRFQ